MAVDIGALLHQGIYRTPGIYIEETRAEDKAQGLRTGVPVFVGFVDSRGHDRSNSLTSCLYLTRWEQFARHLGTGHLEGFLAHAVSGFFQNGGDRCIVMPVPAEDPHSAAAIPALMEAFAQGSVLDDVEDVDLVCVPDAVLYPAETVIELQSAVLEHCHRLGDRFAILDALHDPRSASTQARPSDSAVEKVVQHWEALPPSNGAIYYPWIYVEPAYRSYKGHPRASPVHVGHAAIAMNGNTRTKREAGLLVPPCGHIAGVYARTDASIGVHKAPANEVVEGALNLQVDLGDDEQGQLNDAGVNCLRAFPGRGIRVWGARTLSGQPNWRYVNVSRLFLTLTRWLRKELGYLAFEPNSPQLWAQIRQRISAYCMELFRRGALKGASPAEAFFVKCDAETNPFELREAGQVVAQIGLAPTLPAEFVVVRLVQSASDLTVAAATAL